MVAIKDMEMPENCVDCMFKYVDFDSFECDIHRKRTALPERLRKAASTRRPKHCPLVEVEK